MQQQQCNTKQPNGAMHAEMDHSHLPVDGNLRLLEVAPVLLIKQDQVDRVLDAEPIVYVLVARPQLNSLQVHPDGHDLSPVRAAVHDLELDHCLGLRLRGGACAEGLLPDEGDLHALEFDLDEMEANPAHDDVPEVVEGLVVLEVDVQAVLNAYLHLHRDHLLSVLYIATRQQHREVYLLHYAYLTVHNHSDEVPHSPSNPVERLVLLLEVRELELVTLSLHHDARWLQFFRGGHELGGQILAGVYLQATIDMDDICYLSNPPRSTLSRDARTSSYPSAAPLQCLRCRPSQCSRAALSYRHLMSGSYGTSGSPLGPVLCRFRLTL